MSRAGGLARMRLHGNPGTPEGRRLGGLRSQKTHKKIRTGFKLLRVFPTPSNSIGLAELVGILAGDGHIGAYQISVTTNSKTDLEHIKYTKKLFEKIFPATAFITFRSDCNACVMTVSSKSIGDALVKKGMVRGHKIRGSLCMPEWIKSNSSFKKAFLRGLFDTDGSVYLDRHIIKNKTYENISMLFTNRCIPLLDDFKASLIEFGFRPTQKTDFAVFLRRKEDIRRYFEIIGSSNPKHLKKIASYFNS
jgi:intein/homing endonuclease